MKKLTDWFLSQRNGTKIGLIVLVLVVFIGGLATLVGFLNPNEENSNPEPTRIVEPEPEPTPTVEPSNPDGGVEDDPNIIEPIPDEEDEAYDIELPEGAPYNDVALADLFLTFAPNAAQEECTITLNESREARQARLAPYFTPNSNQFTTPPSPIIENQICSLMAQRIVQVERDSFAVQVEVNMTTYTTYTYGESDDTKTAEQGLKEYVYTVNFIDGKWVVVS